MSPGAQVTNAPIGHRSKSLSNPGSLSAAARRDQWSNQLAKTSDWTVGLDLSPASGSIFLDDGSIHVPPSAKVREKKLRADPLVTVLSPLYVSCNLCQTRIKLSTKSMFDLCHWRTHRARCLKRKPKGLNVLEGPSSVKHEVRNTPEEPNGDSGSSSTMTPKPSPTSPKSLKSKRAGMDVADGVGSLSSSVYDDDSAHHLKEKSHDSPSDFPVSPSADLGASSPASPSASDLAFEAWMTKSQRKAKQHPLENWKDWSWSQLVFPRFDYPPVIEAEEDTQEEENEGQPISEPMLNAVVF